MSALQMKIIIAGIRIKLARGEDLEGILENYIKLSGEEKDRIRKIIGG